MNVTIEKSFFLGDGRGLASGFYQAMFLTCIGATINVNSTFTCFYQPFNLVHFLCEYLQHDIVQDGIIIYSFSSLSALI